MRIAIYEVVLITQLMRFRTDVSDRKSIWSSTQVIQLWVTNYCVFLEMF